MNNQERQALIERCKENIERAENTESYISGHELDLQIQRLALATLTADRKAIAQKVHWMCERTGASYFIAAELALDELLDSQDDSKEVTNLEE